MLSLNSLLSRLGGLPAAVAVGVLAQRFGLTAALAFGAAVTAAAAPLYLLGARSPGRSTAPARTS